MKAIFTSPTVEPLESRIAPAQFFVGASGAAETTLDTEYDEAPFVNTGTGIDPISLAVGGNANTHYLKLNAGDELFQFFQGGGYQKVITVTKGSLVAFFVDKTTEQGGITNEVESGELKGIALGPNVSAEIATPVDGDIATVYDPKLGRLSFSPGGPAVANDLLGPKQGIAKLTIGGSVNGGIFAGGIITNLTVQGNVEQIANGLAANGVPIDFFNIAGAAGEHTLAVTAAPGEAGSAITAVRVGSLGDLILPGTGLIAAGTGGAGAKGGALSQIQVLQDTDGFTLRAGNGGAGIVGKLNGGAGGEVNTLFVSGFTDTTPGEAIHIFSGDGGAGAPAALGKAPGNGGAAGKLTNVFVGYDSVNKVPVASGPLLQDYVEIASGTGGNGKTGGLGGALTNVKVRVDVSDKVGVFDEISVRSGDGGRGIDLFGGAAGAGGAISKLDVRNQHLSTFDPDIFVKSGDGGVNDAPSVAKGGTGGSLTDLTLLGFNAVVQAGDGSDGKVGGLGGSLSLVRIVQDDTIITHTLVFEAGMGGDGGNGNGGNGGQLKDVKVLNSDLSLFTVNANGGGDGGVATKGKGGLGGSVTDLNVTDDDTGFAIAGNFILRGGQGGDGTKGGGKGGDLTKANFFSLDLGVDARAGDGGMAVTEGNGGAGGLLNGVNFTADGLLNGVPVNGLAFAGVGGDGAGKGSGGAGGDLKFVNINVDGNIEMVAGDGGEGTLIGAAGKGGAIVTSGAFAEAGSGLLQAGNAGMVGGKAANGGSILGGTANNLTALRSETALTILAGDGSNGGYGGDIKGISFGSTAKFLSPTPSDEVLIQAGDGSAVGKTAGKGGSISQVNGNPSSGAGKFTKILAGDVLGVASKSANGGSVSNVDIFGVGDDGELDNTTFIIIEAGDANDSATATAGGKGGDVKFISVSNLDPDTLLRSVGAGDGADAAALKGKGGMGGTIDNVHVLGGVDVATGAVLPGDIGVRQGQSFGYDTMGGVFAGKGGAAAVVGLAGNVTNVTADAIAAIVAGKSLTPTFAEKVEKITLNGLDRLKTAGNSPFTVNYGILGTTPILAGTADPDDLETAINALANPAVPDVSVIRTQNATFQLTNVDFGNIDQFTGEENVAGDVTEVTAGEQEFTADETVVGSTVSREEQTFTPFTNGTYTLRYLNATETPDINFDDPAPVVEAQLNGLVTITNAGGVTVTGTPAGGFTVKFNLIGVRDDILGSAQIQEVQTVDVLALGQFTLTGDIGTTPRLNANATAAEVDAALDGFVTGGVSVVDGPNSSYVVTFNNPGQQGDLRATEFIPLLASTIAQGDAVTLEKQALSFNPRNTFTLADYNAANLVGAIADPNEIGSPVFKFINNGGGAGFDLGDTPIDGLIMARVFNQATVNFTPEAKLVGGVFFDFNNKI